MRRLHETHTAGIKWHMLSEIIRYLLAKAFINITSNNQRLGLCGRQRSEVKTLLLQRCALRKFHVTDGQNTRDQTTRGRRSKRSWSICVLCIPFILSKSSNESWLHTCDTCVMTTWRLGLRAPLVARNYYCFYYHYYWFILFIISSYSSYSLCLDNFRFRSRLPPSRVLHKTRLCGRPVSF